MEKIRFLTPPLILGASIGVGLYNRDGEYSAKAREFISREIISRAIETAGFQFRGQFVARCDVPQKIYFCGAKEALPFDSSEDVKRPVSSPWFDDGQWKSIAFGTHAGVAISSDGYFSLWGQLQAGNHVGPKKLEFTSPGVYAIQGSFTETHLYVLDNQGILYEWEIDELLADISARAGDEKESCVETNGYKVRSPEKFRTKTWLPFFSEKFIQIAAGNRHLVIRSNKGNVYCMGSNSHSQCGRKKKRQTHKGVVSLEAEHDEIFLTPSPLKTPAPIVHIAAGGRHTVLLDTQGRAFSVGDDRQIQLGLGDTRTRIGRTELGDSPSDRAVGGRTSKIAANWIYKYDEEHEVHQPVEILPPQNTGRDGTWKKVDHIVCGEEFTVFQYSATPSWFPPEEQFHALMASGDNRFGQCGSRLATHQQPQTQVKLGGAPFVETFSCGSRHCLAKLRSGHLFGWGYNNRGQLARKGGKLNMSPRKVDFSLKEEEGGDIWVKGKENFFQNFFFWRDAPISFPPPKRMETQTAALSRQNVKKVEGVFCDFDNSAIIVKA